MSDLRLTSDHETTAGAESMPKPFDIAAWLPRIGVSMFFILVVGVDKLSTNPHGPWVKMFETIGLGQWLRYLTGALQISGGLLFLFIPTMTIGALLLGATMVGATIAQIFFLHSPGSAVIPLALLGLIVTVWFRATRRR